MVRILDLDANNLSLDEVVASLTGDDEVYLSRGGHIVARIDAADDDDLESELWAQQPEQIQQGIEARKEQAEGRTIDLPSLRRKLFGSE